MEGQEQAPSSLIRHRKDDPFLVYLNVYDVNPAGINPFLRWLGLGSTVSCVQVHGLEFMFGDQNSLRLSDSDELRRLRHSILIGRTQMNRAFVCDYVVPRVRNEYRVGSYNLFTKNCHHFSDRLCELLTIDNGIPWWVNRNATLFGLFCRCLPMPAEDDHEPDRQERNTAADHDNGDADADTDGARNDHNNDHDGDEEHHEDGDHNSDDGDDDGDEEPPYSEILQREARVTSRPTARYGAPAATAAEAAVRRSNGRFWSSLIHYLSLRF